MSGLRNIFQTGKRFLHKRRKLPLDPDHAKKIPVTQYVLAPHTRNRVYVWGCARTGALGVPSVRQNISIEHVEYLRSPKRLHFAEQNEVISIGCGFGFSLFNVKTPDGPKLYGTGLNTDSQIGYHDIRRGKPLGILFAPREVFLPLKNPSKSCVKKVCSGRAHTAVVTDEGLFLFGNNVYGQCGRPVVENEDYSSNCYLNHIESIDGKEVVDVECGQDHTMVITEDGSVYACGWGADGQTGLGHYNAESQFSKVNGDITNEKIVKLACRSDFVLALNNKQEVFGWGNVEYSQITSPKGTQQICDPTYVKMLEDKGKIKDVATGGCSCLILTESGNVFVWGFGLLGVGPNVQESSVPIEIPQQLFGFNDFNTDCRVESITCGLSHMAAVTSKGDLFTWGRNRNSCLGLGHSNDQYFPLKVAIGAHVSQACCGLDHTMAICKSYLTENV